MRSLTRPKITVVTVVYNAVETLEQCIKSVIEQSYRPLEYVVIDGGSSDGSLDLIRKYEDYIDAWVSEPDDGVYDAMNKGIEKATGDVVGLLNADDFYEEETADIVARTHADHPESVIVGAMNRVQEDGSTFTLRRNLTHQYLEETILYTMPVNHPATFVPATVYDRLGTFDSQFHILGDYDFICRCHANDVPFVFVDEVLTNMRVGGLSSGANNVVKRAGERYAVRQKNNMVGEVWNASLSVQWMMSTLLKGAVKSLLPNAVKARLYRRRHGQAQGEVNT